MTWITVLIVCGLAFLAGVVFMGLLVSASNNLQAHADQRSRETVAADWAARDARALELLATLPPAARDEEDHSLDIWPWHDTNWPEPPTNTKQ